MLAHRGIADTEKQQNKGDDQIGTGNARAIAEDGRDGHRTRHADQWRRGCDDKEHNPDDADTTLAQGGLGSLGGSRLQIGHGDALRIGGSASYGP